MAGGGAVIDGAVTGGGTGAAGGAVTDGAVTDNGSTVGAVSDPGVVDAGQVCDVDTGACGVAAVGGVSPAAGGVVAVGAVLPTVLDQDSGWGPSIGLMLLVILLTVGLVLVPALVWRHYSKLTPT